MKKIVALVTGGFTGESVISFKSAEVIDKNLDREKFEVYKIIITINSWYYVSENGIKYEVNKNNFSFEIDGHIVYFDAAFIGLHGSPGEDGKLQGYFDMLEIPYTTCNALTSAITMNKGYTKAIVTGIQNLYTARSVQLFLNSTETPAEILSTLKLPLFIKPNNGGSSIGMSKVKTEEELPAALERAFKEDNQVLVEEFVKGREYTIGIYKGYEGIKVLPSTEVVTSKEFFDFEAKYTAGITEEITPGRMSDEERSRVDKIAVDVYRKLGCRSVVRIDFILEESSGKFFFIEINTVPGQTENSFIPQQVRATGQTMKEFYSELLEVAMGK